MSEKRSSSQKHRRLNARARALLLVLALLIATLAVIFSVRACRNTTQAAKELPFSTSTHYAFVGPDVAYSDGAFLHYNDLLRDKANWYHELSIDNPKIAASPTMIAAYGSNIVQLVSPQGETLVNPIEFSSTILNVVCGKSYFAVLSEDTQGIPSLSIISVGGQQAPPLQYPNSTVLNFAFYGEADSLWVLSANVEGASPVLTISTYKTAGTMSITSIVPIQGELIDSIAFSGQTLYAVGTNYLYSFDSTGQVRSQKQIYGWELLDQYTQDNKSSFLFRSYFDAKTPEKTFRVKLSSNQTDDVNFRFPATCIGGFLYADKIVAVSANHVYIFDLSGTLMRDYALDQSYDSVQKLDNNRILLIRGESLYIAPLR